VSDRESLVDRLIGAAGEGEDPRAAQFVRGLALGALVGAAIAGSTIWQRRRATGRSFRVVEAESPQPSTTTATEPRIKEADAGR
jgi:hypothetical protein